MCVSLYQFQYVSLAMNKTLVLPWISQLKEVLWRCCLHLKTLRVSCLVQVTPLKIYIQC